MVEVNPVRKQKKLREEHRGEPTKSWIVRHSEIADAKGKTVAQVCLRWVYEKGVSVLVKSFNKERIKENLDIFDWMLSPEESHKINRIPQQRGYLGLHFISDQDPYKSIEEFWDEEI
ncbi:unnamed protein product [Camellia sinensis]